MEEKFYIAQTDDAKDLPLPAYMTPGAAGMDLYANIAGRLRLGPGERRLIPVGIRIALPYSFEAQIRPRSGLALRHGVSMLNAPGTVDADYRGELAVLLINLGAEEFIINRGDRIAQLVISGIKRVEWCVVGFLDDTRRGSGGFGHTGTA